MTIGTLTPSGNLKIKKISPKTNYALKFKKWLKLFGYRLRILKKAITTFGGDVNYFSALSAKVIRKDGSTEDLGILSTKVVTTAGVNFIVDAFQNLVEVENLKFHASGTGVGAEAAGDTALGTEVASRATGSTGEGASANIYRTVGTISYSASFAITEHGIFDQLTVGGTLLDRSVFTAINVTSGDSIEFTYELTFPSGG